MPVTETMIALKRRTHPERIRGRHVAVLGLARTGEAVCDLLLKGGAQVHASEIREDATLHETASRLRGLGAQVELGKHSVDTILQSDYVVPSPGLPLSHPVLQQARRRGIPIFSEIEVAAWLCSMPVLAVTGTNGKTTTATWLQFMLKEGGLNPHLAGNVGTAFSRVATRASGPVVLEVSSYQLEHIETFRPHVAGLINVTPDHLERHGDLSTYAATKYRLAENQVPGDTAVLNADDALAREMPVPDEVRRTFFSIRQFLPEGVFCTEGRLIYRLAGEEGELIRLDRIGVPGWHNQANAAAASAMALAFGVDTEALSRALAHFTGVPHRIEYLGDFDGRRVYNDSKATNVGAMQVALEAVMGPIVLLVGGRHKGDDPHTVDNLVRERVRTIVAYGESRERFAEAWSKLRPVRVVDNLEAAVTEAFAASQPGDAILLSPACASFDQFRDFEERGDCFRAYVDAQSAQH
jgi:UDP-N-acetylmuramoylalanine--D-glutamate ligase